MKTIVKLLSGLALAITLTMSAAGISQAQVLNSSKITINPILVSSQYCHGHKKVTGRTGIATRRSKAEQRARRKWKERVVWLMPWSWGQADWSKAKQRAYKCRKKHGTWRCKASAIPCAGWP